MTNSPSPFASAIERFHAETTKKVETTAPSTDLDFLPEAIAFMDCLVDRDESAANNGAEFDDEGAPVDTSGEVDDDDVVLHKHSRAYAAMLIAIDNVFNEFDRNDPNYLTLIGMRLSMPVKSLISEAYKAQLGYSDVTSVEPQPSLFDKEWLRNTLEHVFKTNVPSTWFDIIEPRKQEVNREVEDERTDINGIIEELTSLRVSLVTDAS